jgi:triosephosphate isomerase
MRTPLMAANWKMFKTPADTKAFFDSFLPLVKDSSHCEIAVCAPFIDLPAAIEATAGSRVAIGAQNLYWANEGAFTGEISGPMLKALGCEWVIVGHSERRQYFGETDETVLKRTQAAIAAGLKVIVCAGEMLAEREAGQTNAVLEKQFTAGIAPLSPEEFSQIVIAYEPVWAIGTGKTATPEMAADAHAAIRSLAAARFDAASLRILYGGSVKPDNVASLMAQEEIDGALVGGASLDPTSFSRIVNY